MAAMPCRRRECVDGLEERELSPLPLVNIPAKLTSRAARPAAMLRAPSLQLSLSFSYVPSDIEKNINYATRDMSIYRLFCQYEMHPTKSQQAVANRELRVLVSRGVAWRHSYSVDSQQQH